ncbi:MAG: hypothetical protein ACRDT6_27980 [Micromonosporaceae bacterium]
MDPTPPLHHPRPTRRLLRRAVAAVAVLAALAAGMTATAGTANATHAGSANWLTDPGKASGAVTLTWNRIYINGREMRVELRRGTYGTYNGNVVKYVWARHSYCCGSGKHIELLVTERYTNKLIGRSQRDIDVRRYTAGYRVNGHRYNYEACIYYHTSSGAKRYLVCTGKAGIDY